MACYLCFTKQLPHDWRQCSLCSLWNYCHRVLLAPALSALATVLRGSCRGPQLPRSVPPVCLVETGCGRGTVCPQLGAKVAERLDMRPIPSGSF